MAQKICQVPAAGLAPAPPGGCWVGLSQFRDRRKPGGRPPPPSLLAGLQTGAQWPGTGHPPSWLLCSSSLRPASEWSRLGIPWEIQGHRQT